MTTEQIVTYIVAPILTAFVLGMSSFAGLRAERAKDRAEEEAKKSIAAIQSELKESVRQNIQLIGSLQSVVVANHQSTSVLIDAERLTNTPSVAQPVSQPPIESMTDAQRKNVQATLLKSSDRVRKLLDEDTDLKRQENHALERAAMLDRAHAEGIQKIIRFSIHAAGEIAKIDSGIALVWDTKSFPPHLTFTEYQLRGRHSDDAILATAKFSPTIKVNVSIRYGLVKSPPELLNKEGIGSYSSDTDLSKPITIPAVLVQFIDEPTNTSRFAYYESTGPVTTPPFSDGGNPKVLEDRIYSDLAECVANLKADADFARKKQAERR